MSSKSLIMLPVFRLRRRLIHFSASYEVKYFLVLTNLQNHIGLISLPLKSSLLFSKNCHLQISIYLYSDTDETNVAS